jgi:hypothetical protein
MSPAMAEREAEVWVQIAGRDVFAGRLWSHRRRGAESQTFSYDSGYIASGFAYELDPALPLVLGQQQTPTGRAIFGAFSDCAPDRWGRRLIGRAERQRARAAGEAPYPTSTIISAITASCAPAARAGLSPPPSISIRTLVPGRESSARPSTSTTTRRGLARC